MVAPSAAGVLAFTLIPIVFVAWWSLTRYDLLTRPHYVGLANYRYMAHDPFLGKAITNTLWILAVGLPLQLVVSISLALLVARRGRANAAVRTVVFLPSVLPPVAATLALGWLLQPGTGFVNRFLGLLHLPKPLWFSDPTWSKPGLVLLGLWGVGPVVILMIAGLVRIPRQLYEAALLEGAGPWRRFRTVTLPMLAPVILFTIVIGTVGALQYFTEAFVASSNFNTGDGGLTGAPQGSMRFYATWLFRNAFEFFRAGYASALAMVLFLASLAAMALLLLIAKRFGVEERRR
jgi:multiple sugar transport system permease protein